MHPETPSEIAALVVLDIAVIVVVARLIGRACVRLGQPSVIGEILAGVALGPSLLGALPGDPTSFLFPAEVRPYLTVVASLGLVIYMFVVGLELNLDLVRGKERLAATISLSSVALPFGLGTGLAWWLHEQHDRAADGSRIDLLPFALFIGASMSVTAFPVLARILAEHRLNRAATGALALACAAVDDVLAWIMLAVVLAVIQAGDVTDLLLMTAESVGFVLVIFFVVAPRLRGLVRVRQTEGRLTPDAFAVVMVGTFVSSFITEEIGIHAIFGAFLFGAAMPRRGAEQLTQEVLERVEPITVLLLLPVFFITTGLKVDVTGLGGHGVVELAVVLAVACTGKFVGAAVAARLGGVHTRRAAALGVLMNTRGLTELVILNIGYEVGVLDRDLFTILVLMALVTTVMTSPILRRIYSPRHVAREIAQAERLALGLSAPYRVVAAVDQHTTPGAVDVAARTAGGEASAQLLLLRLDQQPPGLGLGAGLGAELELVAVTYEAMERLAAAPRALGLGVVTRSQFTQDPTADVLQISEAADADVLVWLRAEGPPPAELLRDVEVPVVWLAAGGGGDAPEGAPDRAPDEISVEVGRSGDGLAAVEHAARISLATGVPLVLVPDPRGRRRAESLRPRLERLGLRVRVDEDGLPAPRTWRLAGATDRARSDTSASSPAGEGALTVLVKAAPDDHGQRLESLLARPLPTRTSGE